MPLDLPPNQQVVWSPIPGRQHQFVTCPIEDILFGGARGGAKTDGVLGKWLMQAHRYKHHARGLMLRPELTQLDDVIQRSREIYEPLGGEYKQQAKTWTHPDGWTLRFRYVANLSDAAKYLGHSYTFIAVEELTEWADFRPIDKIRGTLRSAHGVPCQFVATANPGGPGHNKAKARYVDPVPGGMVPFYACALCSRAFQNGDYVCDCPEDQRAPIQRIYIPATLDDNPFLKHDPQYWRTVTASVAGDRELLRAWRKGDWNIKAGGMFDDIWRPCGVTIDPFDIPANWYVDRGYDHGDTAPNATIWFAESNGEEVTLRDGTSAWYPAGTLFAIAEDYGWNGEPNEGSRRTVAATAADIREREAAMKARGFVRGYIYPGPADSAIWAVQDGESIADRFEAHGIEWEKAPKGQGSRVAGWGKIREMMLNNAQALPAGTKAEWPGLYVFRTCPQTIRTLNDLPRDKRNRDDADTAAEDHLPDVVRYRCMAERSTATVGRLRGV